MERYNWSPQWIYSLNFYRLSRGQGWDFQKKVQDRIAIVVSEISEFVEPISNIEEITIDKKDNRVLEAALKGRVKYIVSGDKYLLELRKWKGIEILSARDFIEKISSK